MKVSRNKKMISIARGLSQTEGVFYDETIDPVNQINFHPCVGNYIR
jgi:hypothetical protein